MMVVETATNKVLGEFSNLSKIQDVITDSVIFFPTKRGAEQ